MNGFCGSKIEGCKWLYAVVTCTYGIMSQNSICETGFCSGNLFPIFVHFSFKLVKICSSLVVLHKCASCNVLYAIKNKSDLNVFKVARFILRGLEKNFYWIFGQFSILFTPSHSNFSLKLMSYKWLSWGHARIHSFWEFTKPEIPKTEALTSGVLRNFAKFTEKHLCQSLFFTKVAGQTVAGKLNNCFFQNRKVKLH